MWPPADKHASMDFIKASAALAVERRMRGLPCRGDISALCALQKVADWLKQLRDGGLLEPTSMIQSSNLKSACGLK